MAINPDILYLRSREDLLPYEDSRLNSLIQALANYYTTRNDQSLWGNILRSLAMELAKLEYDYAYDLVNKQSQYLTPPDIRRRWADPLFVSRNYPTSLQFDLDYRTMLVDLLLAYKKGATTSAIHDVILAYTGKDIVVEELYKEIGNGIYDRSDGNAITVAVNVGGSDPLTDIQNLLELQSITQDLYGAIDLTKPAHVGLNFTTVFGSDENIDAFVTDISESPISGISDDLRIFVSLVEDEPFGPMLYQAPMLDPATPQTTLAAYGRTFPPVLTPEEWETLSFANGSLLVPFAAEPPLAAWQADYLYAVGDTILDANWNIQTVTTAGTSGGSTPTFTLALNGTTTDGPTLVWTNTAPTAKGAYTVPAPSGPDVYTLQDVSRNWLILLDVNSDPTGYLANFDPAHPAGLLAPRLDQSWEISGGDQAFIFELT